LQGAVNIENATRNRVKRQMLFSKRLDDSTSTKKRTSSKVQWLSRGQFRPRLRISKICGWFLSWTKIW